MAQVETVRGPVDTADLGRTYMHEHIFVLTADVQQNYPGEWGDEDARVADAVDKLRALAAQGVRTIVDPTVVGLGRYLPRVVRVAEAVPELNIVVATGCYTYDSVPFFFHYRGPALNAALGAEVPDPMVDLFVADIEEGYISTTSCILANMALNLGRTLAWDPQANRVVGDDEANRLLARPYRAPWVHPGHMG